MELLILGGTVFLGRHLVEAALARGHRVTLFNRGQHNPDLFPEVEKLRGDRDPAVEPGEGATGSIGLAMLHGRRWDAVIDTCGYVPRVVRAAAELLAGAVDHYTFISSISVYGDLSTPATNELTPVDTLEDETVENVEQFYGPLKALCEQAAERAMPGRVLHVRPGLIVGPHDPSDRFTYWVGRVARGGEVLAPGQPNAPVQVIDGRDLAEWIVRMVEGHQTGIYNATGPDYALTLGGVLEECKAVTGSDARFAWVADQFLLDEGVRPWSELPLWLGGRAEMGGLMNVNCGKALDAGLTFRPLADTIRDTLAWDATRPADQERRAGMPPEREVELLRAWRARS